VVLPSGQKLPAPALVEGPDGFIYLLVASDSVSVRLWASAKMAGITGLIKPKGYDWKNPQYVTTAYFEEQAQLNPQDGLYELPGFVWYDDMPEGYFGAENASQGREEAVSDEQPVGESLFVHLHNHSEHSALDGLATIQEIVDRAVELGQKSVAVTDHGNVAAHPDLQDVCEEAGIKPIFGMEAYLVDDRFSREDRDYYHITLWAMDDQGLANLWAMSTEGYRDGYHAGHPRLDFDTLERFNSGVLASSGCLRGPLSKPYNSGNPAQALHNLSRLKEIFGDRFYVEIHTNQLDDQLKVNPWLVEQARAFDIPLIAAVDSHYALKSERDDHQVWLSMQTGKDVETESSLFGGGQEYHMFDDEEVMMSLLYLGEDVVVECMENTLTFADRCTAKIKPKEGMPIYSVGENAEELDADRLLDLCLSNWEERTAGKNYTQEEAVARFEHEFPMLARKKFPGYFLMNNDLVSYAKDNGVLVGPGRGSGAGSFVAYLARITEVDPIENDLLFARFMTEGRTALPDFDIDYPSSRKQFMIEYAQSRWGKNHVVAVGTHTRLQNKGAFKKTAAAIRSRLPEEHYADLNAISAIINHAEASTAGLGLSWDELFASVGDELEPFKQKYPELFELAGKFRGRLSTYSRHAAGLVIDPNSNLEEHLPMFLAPDGKTLVTQFDKDVLEKLNYVKFDFLNLRNLDTIQDTIDLIKEQTGEVIDVNKWREEYNDQNVYQMLTEGWTLGVFQLETKLGTRTIKQVKPQSIADISDSITVARPGPMRSGLDKMFFRRRNGEEEVSFPEPRLATVLAKTYGAMLYQEDIMATCMILAKYDDNEADKVRRILGKKKKELVEAEGKKFIEKAVANGTDPKVAESIWADMAEFALYSFNRAHAFSYGVLSYWTAWFKYHYPGQYMTSLLTGEEADALPDVIQETRRLGYQVLPPDINQSKAGFYPTGKAIRYGFESINGVGSAATEIIVPAQPFTSFEDFLERGTHPQKCNMGVVKKLVHVGAFDSIVPNRKALELRLAEEDVKPNERCIFFRSELNEFGLPCNFDWNSEPAPIGRTGKPTKRKPPPKRCTKGCRQYIQRPLVEDQNVEPYTEAEIRSIEMEAFGVYLSSSPFDIIDPEDRELLTTGNDLQLTPEGTYLTAILITDVRSHKTRKGDPMKFIKAMTPSGDVDLTVFANGLNRFGKDLTVGAMALAEVTKNSYGITLRYMQRID
jgi:DNA polymerase-3 subunit alpha